MGTVLGSRSREEWGSQPWQVQLSVHCSTLPLLFPQSKHRLCQLWKLQSLRLAAAAGTCLGGPGSRKEVGKVEGHGVFHLIPQLTVHGDADPLPFTSLPRANTHRCYYSGKN